MEAPNKEAEKTTTVVADVVASTAPAVALIAAAPAPVSGTKTSKLVVFKSKVPAHWHLEATEDEDVITAYNSVTAESFTGSMADFNAALRG